MHCSCVAVAVDDGRPCSLGAPGDAVAAPSSKIDDEDSAFQGFLPVVSAVTDRRRDDGDGNGRENPNANEP
jgi:hypothetical protein